jgi:hypothetical protein
MKVKQTNSYLAPTSLRQDIELPFGKQSVYSDGTTGWLASIQGMQGISPAVVKQVRGEVFRQMVRIVLSDRLDGVTVSLAGNGAVEISSKDGESARLEVDEKTGVPLKISYPQEGGSGTVVQEYSDWRDVGGMRLPFHWVITQGGKKFATVTVDDYKVNSGLTPDALGKKP